MTLDLNSINKLTEQSLGNIYRGVATVSPDSEAGLGNLAAQSISIFKNYDFSSVLEILKIAGIVLSILFGALFVWVAFKMRKTAGSKVSELTAGFNPPSAGESKYDAKWKEVLEHLQSLREAEWKFAVIEVDNIIEEILTQAGYPGETLGEKLKQIDRNQLASIDDIWEAHKLRNLIVHDPDYQIRYNDARVAIGQYEKALRELGVLG